MHYWADLQSVHGFRCCDNIAPNTKCKRVLVLVVCLVRLTVLELRVSTSYSAQDRTLENEYKELFMTGHVILGYYEMTGLV